MSEFDLPEEFEGEFSAEDFEMTQSEAPEEYEFARLLLTGGDQIFLPIAKNEGGENVPQSIMEAAIEAGLSIPSTTQFWVDGVQVNPNETLLVSNMRITAIGNVKGGS